MSIADYGFAIWETFYVTVLSTAFALVLGLPLGVLLVAGDKDGVLPLPGWLMHILNIVINLLRSVPFLILMICVFPLTRVIVGTTVGTKATIVPLVEFFGETMFEARFTLAYEPDEAPYHVKELTRREMFEQVGHGSKSGTKQLLRMLPGLRADEDGGADFRLLLHQRTRQLKAAMPDNPLHYGCYLPSFTDKCFACGKCEKACRAGALKQEDLPDGQTRMVVTPWKCSECGVCVAACSNKGLDGMKLRQLTTLGPVSVHKCTKTLCKECGKPIAPGSVDGVCTVCRIKARTKKRQEEAAARAKQLREEREAKKAAEEAAKAAAEAGADAAETAVQTAAAPAETAAAGSVITALTPEKAAPAALDETPAAAPENTAEKDVPDTPKND